MEGFFKPKKRWTGRWLDNLVSILFSLSIPRRRRYDNGEIRLVDHDDQQRKSTTDDIRSIAILSLAIITLVHPLVSRVSPYVSIHRCGQRNYKPKYSPLTILFYFYVHFFRLHRCPPSVRHSGSTRRHGCGSRQPRK
jgi:hypothetical protein